MIKLSKLTLFNFGIYKGEVVLEFEGRDIIGILAEYDSDKKRSNRSGKTLILESIRYLLTGLSRAKKEVDMIHHGEDVMWVKGEFIDEQGEIRVVKRGRDKNNKGILNLDWVEKTTESQEAIEDLFGISKADFDLTCFFKQADINGFMDLSPTEKTKFLMKWLDNEHWKEKEAKVKEDIKTYKNRLRDNETTIKALDSSAEVVEDLKNEITLLKDEQEQFKDEYDRHAGIHAKIAKKLNKIEDDKTEANKGLSKLKMKLKDAKSNEWSINDLKDKVKKYKKQIKELNDTALALRNSDIEKLQNSVTETSLEVGRLTKELEIIEQGTGMCPILNEACDRIKFSGDAQVQCEDALSDAKAELRRAKTELDGARKGNEAWEKAKTLKERLSDALSSIKEREGRQSVEEAEKALNEANKAVKIDDSELKEKLRRVEEIVDKYKSKISRNERAIGALESRIENANDALDKINQLTERNEKLKKRLEDLNYLALMFGKNGIPADEIENAFQEVQDDINLILKALDCGLTVSFSPDKELNKWEEICHCGFKYPKGYRKSECDECGSPRLKKRKDEISLKILEGDKEADFGMDSGGGKTIISYAVRIALTMLKRRQNKSKLNILFLDEVDSALDSHLAGSITDSITKVLTKKLGYDQILMVSHKDEIKNSVPHILKVTRFDTYSKAEFV
jgi:DNA repair exonuclease SbcCD ATPase subunit